VARYHAAAMNTLMLTLVLATPPAPATGALPAPVAAAQQPPPALPTAAAPEPSRVLPPTPALVPLPAGDLHLDGWLGARVDANRTHWLDRVDLEVRIAPFAHRPAQQPWAGEHLGKWLHAASIGWQYSSDPVLRTRLDGAAAALMAAQEDDGYLGTYLPAQRFQLLPGADWDVWTIKYALLGLLQYHAATGSKEALQACERAADLLLRTFGTGPGQRSILSAGTHVGMAATSVLEPVARLYRATGKARYLEFARYLVASWDQAGGPGIARSLREHRHVAQTANGKAYEMLSNLLGLCELYRATGDADLLAPVLAAFDDIVANELLPTGSMSAHEHFVGGGRLPSAMPSNVGETCVTVTWMQVCSELFELLGEPRFGREIERTAYNHLLAAQRPDGAEWCYYTALRGHKPYAAAMTCCSSSGARGLAMLPQRCVLQGHDAAGNDLLVFDLLEAAHGTVTLDGQHVEFRLQSALPATGEVRLHFASGLPARFGVRFRLSEWALPAMLQCGAVEDDVAQPGFGSIAARVWQPGDAVTLTVRCCGNVVGDPRDPGRELLSWGPCVLALDGGLVPGLQQDSFGVTTSLPEREPGTGLRLRAGIRQNGALVRLPLLPFADAGAAGDDYRVWLSSRSNQSSTPVVGTARSRPGNVEGAIADGDRDSFVVTWDGKPAAADWYAVSYAQPRELRAVSFAHGHCFHDGGWFDTSAGKPEVQIRSHPGAAWQTIGRLVDYPATTATDAGGLRDAQLFRLQLDSPVTAVELRVIGRPASGDAAGQAFSSCAELNGF
jgi:uncharacterized protein